MVRSACADILHALPGLSFDRLEEMNWPALTRWREKAIEIIKITRGMAGNG